MVSDVLAPRTVALLDQAWLQRALPALVVALAVLVLAVPMLQSGPAPLTSDESLYLAEGYNVAEGNGPTYTSGEIANHRAPLFSALLSLPIRLTGESESAYWISKFVVVALIGATFLLTQQLFGALAGVLAALLVASNAFLRWLGTTLYLDGAETLLLLLFLAASWRAFQSESTAWFVAAGALFGAAFLTKEAAIQWLPLPIAFALLSAEHRNGAIARGLGAYTATAGAVLGLWWLWVYLATGRIYFWGEPDARLIALTEVAIAGALGIALSWLFLTRFAPRRLPELARHAGLAVVAGWAGATFLVIKLTSWPTQDAYWRAVPQYLWEIAAPNSQPWPFLALALAWLCVRARAGGPPRLLFIAFALFLPFAVLVAERSLAYRDLLPMLYIAYVAAGGLGALCYRWIAERAGRFAAAGALVAGLTLLGVLQTQELVDDWLPYNEAAVTQANWDNPLVRDTARWIDEEVPAGLPIMSSRLYYSQLYVLDEARHPVYQLPTVRVEPRAGETPFLERASTMFRWEDHRLGPSQPDERWLYVRRYPLKGYYVALSEHDLLRDLRERAIDYLVLSGQDAAYSSLTYLDYFRENRAFTLVHEDVRSDASAVYVFRVDRALLQQRPYRAAVSPATLNGLMDGWDGASREDVIDAIDPDGINVRP
ncbi:MAG: glycosyltransferase family 39 protein [Dehalococcoidia bacterium]